MSQRFWVALFFCLPLLAQVKEGKGPHIQFDSLRHNYGKVKQNDHVDHAFRFTNTGDQTLIIEKMVPG